MIEHPNAIFLRRLYGGDRDVLLERMAPEYVTHMPGRSLLAGDFPGDKHLQHAAMFADLTNGSFRKELLGGFLADDNWGFVPQRLCAERNGQTLDQVGFGVWRFRNGMPAEHWGLVADQYTFDRVFS
jgi:ketosteroid isomerase-like protein